MQDSNNINLAMVASSHTTVYRPYSDNCPNSQQYLEMKQQAMRQEKGIWHQANPCMPWHDRNGKSRQSMENAKARSQQWPSILSECLFASTTARFALRKY